MLKDLTDLKAKNYGYHEMDQAANFSTGDELATIHSMYIYQLASGKLALCPLEHHHFKVL